MQNRNNHRPEMTPWFARIPAKILNWFRSKKHSIKETAVFSYYGFNTIYIEKFKERRRLVKVGIDRTRFFRSERCEFDTVPETGMVIGFGDLYLMRTSLARQAGDSTIPPLANPDDIKDRYEICSYLKWDGEYRISADVIRGTHYYELKVDKV